MPLVKLARSSALRDRLLRPSQFAQSPIQALHTPFQCMDVVLHYQTTGDLYCCNSVEKASDPTASTLLGSVGLVLQDPADVLVGLTCSPIGIGSIGSGDTW
ncbi:hypothetical protein OE88DRAFT_1669359 [Heliocybe sulcata]|uniref:Hydrophobin n=1 Tax=Heliocybe sulcata TaxID=5364 RepID=A0A5C3MMU9_9AGAM|nr:hypothetical protein OE88DRAFT_1669359 [Heliocybe sulcata]